MGTLLDLPTGRAVVRQPPSLPLESGHSAAILFFTGVRYMRMEDAPPPCTRGPRRNRKPPMPAELLA